MTFEIRCQCCGRLLENSGMTCYSCLTWIDCACGTTFCGEHQRTAAREHKCPSISVSPKERSLSDAGQNQQKTTGDAK